MPSRTFGHGQVAVGWAAPAITSMTSSRSRATFPANTRNTSSWVTPSPSSTPASVSVTRASAV